MSGTANGFLGTLGFRGGRRGLPPGKSLNPAAPIGPRITGASPYLPAVTVRKCSWDIGHADRQRFFSVAYS
jgi:hypothetical protein